MRVIGGALGGRRLSAPRGRTTRPTSDRVREAVFSILADVEGAVVLDLFAGSGALGIEALSRGALRATLVDPAPAAVTAARANLAVLASALSELGAEAEVVRSEALKFLRRAPAGPRQYDLAFLDPPYDRAQELIPPLAEPLRAVLADDARVVVECARRAPAVLELPLRHERAYGDTLIRIHGAR